MNLKIETKNAIKSYIDEMDSSKSNRLPSDEKFATMLGVSKITLRSALNELVEDGIVFRRQGRGTFVNIISSGIRTSFNPAASFEEIIENNRYKLSVHILGVDDIYADKELSKDLDIAENSMVIVVNKIFYADQYVCACCSYQFSKRLINDTDIPELSRLKESIYQFLYEKTKRQVCWEKVEIETATVDTIEFSEFNKYLDLPKEKMKSFLCLKNISYDRMNAPLLRVFEYVDTKRIKYNLVRHPIINYSKKK